ncbi:MAG: coproporphyrinogen III oxidase family protein [Anaerolineales bacterium]|nr:coproporphyrinogen III oxidase family protein [Anaerolineales bacterium]
MGRPESQPQNLSIYIAIPFCQVRCAYCDFNTFAGLDDLMAPYARALAREIRLVGEAAAGRPVHTIFFGGGTPSLLPLLVYQDIFAVLRGAFALTTDCEITLEANPGTVDAAYLLGLRALGVSRLSFGVQSTHASELRLLDRLHSFEDVRQAVALARAAGFDRASHGLNLDLIFGTPHQTLAMWQASLLRVLALEPEHLSLYALSLEHGTPLRSWVQRGLLPMPDADLAAEMYGWAGELLAAHGYGQYEISNWALPEKAEGRSRRSDPQVSDLRLLAPGRYQCRHNLQYWRNRPYLGLGAGAHGCAAGWRYSNVLAPGAYIARLEHGVVGEFPFSPAAVERTRQTRADEMGETMLLGLRLTAEGVGGADFEARFGATLAAAYGRRLRHLRGLGLLAWDEAGARLTPAGRLLGNRVFREFV